MTIVERQVGDVVVLDIHGKIHIGEDYALRETVTRLVDAGHTKVVLNLVDVPYVDSAGLGEIVRSFTRVSRAAAGLQKFGRLKLLSPTKKIEDLLSITKLRTIFEIYDNEAEAVESFA